MRLSHLSIIRCALLAIFILIIGTACNSTKPSPLAATHTPRSTASTGDPVHGEFLFQNTSDASGRRCSLCHDPNSPTPGLGPYLYGIANVAAERSPDLSAEEYLRQSILDPSAIIAPAQSGLTWENMPMPLGWSEVLSASEIDDLVAYLMTLKQVE